MEPRRRQVTGVGSPRSLRRGSSLLAKALEGRGVASCTCHGFCSHRETPDVPFPLASDRVSTWMVFIFIF